MDYARLIALSFASFFALGALSGWVPCAKGLDGEGLTVMTHYCPWYHPVGGKWDDGITGTPLLGFYESDDQGIVSQHIEWAEEYVERPFPTLYVLLGLLAISPIAILLFISRSKKRKN